LLSAYAFALDVPSLTGRVVDQADVMTAESRSDVEAKWKDLEDKSGIQLVVAKVKSLQGGDIETYANELFRSWKLGQAQKNDGVLLLVAPAENKVRIEVGYGLEGTLTDAISSVIISSAIIPHFKNGDFPGGIEGGVNGIISVLNGDSASWQPVVGTREDISSGRYVIIFFVFSVLIGAVILAIQGIIHPKPRGHYVKRVNRMVLCPLAIRRGIRQAGAAAILPTVARPPTISPAVAGRRAVAGRQGAGDAIHKRRSRGDFGRYPRCGGAYQRTDRLCPRALVFCLCLCPDPLGERPRAFCAVAAD